MPSTSVVLQPPARSAWVDRAKGLGIVLVVYGHVGRGLMGAGILPEQPGTLLDSVIYAFHMPLFFLLSGLFFQQSLERKGRVRLLASKVDTLLYPYVVWFLIQGSVMLAMGSHLNRPISELRPEKLLLAPPGQFWFLWALFWMFMLGVLAMGRDGSRTRRHIVLLLAGAAYLAAAYGGSRMPWWHVAGFFVYFWLGVCLGSGQWRAPRSVVLAWLLAALIGEAAFHMAGLRFDDYGVWTLLLAVVCVIAVCTVCASMGAAPAGWMERLGATSMDIYLMHILAASGTRVILDRGLGIRDLACHLILGCLAGLVVPMLAGAWMRRLGATWLFTPPGWASVERLWQRWFGARAAA